MKVDKALVHGMNLFGGVSCCCIILQAAESDDVIFFLVQEQAALWKHSKQKIESCKTLEQAIKPCCTY